MVWSACQGREHRASQPQGFGGAHQQNPPPPQQQPKNDVCALSLPGTVTFSECMEPPRTDVSVPDCFSYDLDDADLLDSAPACIPGILDFHVTGAFNYDREALVEAVIVDGASISPSRITLNVKKIMNWPASEARVGDALADLTVANGKITSLRFGRALHAQTGAQSLQAKYMRPWQRPVGGDSR